MPTLFLSAGVARRHAAELQRIAGESQRGPLEIVTLPSEGLVDAALLPALDAAFISAELEPPDMRRFFGAVRRAPNLQWVHIGWSGSDEPALQGMMDRGVMVSNSSGVASEPIALTTIGALLALHRGFPRWFEAQRRHAWEKLPNGAEPPDLRGQVLTILGLGAIGQHVARIARELGLHVVGVRRSPAGATEHVDEWLPPERFKEVLPRTDWLVIAIPLTASTRGVVDAEALALLPRGAHVINVARGPIVDEAALIDALRSGHLAGAYLDVFDVEPLPPDSPFWDLPNVIVSPHDSSPSGGNNGRGEAMFLEELSLWVRGLPLKRQVTER